MIDVTSNKFKELSSDAKLLLLTAVVVEKEIIFSKLFCEVIGLTYPNDELYFINKIKEIENQKINYKLEKLIFKKPTINDIENFLQLLRNQLKKSLSLPQIKEFARYFYDYYELKDWKVNKIKMKDWKKQLILAANNWNYKFSDDKKQTSNIVKEIELAFTK